MYFRNYYLETISETIIIVEWVCYCRTLPVQRENRFLDVPIEVEISNLIVGVPGVWQTVLFFFGHPKHS